MDKKFVPLFDREDKNEKKEIKTWQAPKNQNFMVPENLRLETCCKNKYSKCAKPPPEPHSLEDDIAFAYHRPLTLYNMKQINKKYVKLKCEKSDKHTECVRYQRTPSELKLNAVVREKVIKIRDQLAEVRHDMKKSANRLPEDKDVEEPEETEGKKTVKLKHASPTCSVDAIYLPSRKLLDLKAAKDAVFINEKKIPYDIHLPFPSFNPRVLQPIADQISSHTLIERNDEYYVKLPIEIPGIKLEECICPEVFPDSPLMCQEPCCCLYFPKNTENNDFYESCFHNVKRNFEIPNDLDSSFKAEIIFGAKCCDRELEDVEDEKKRRRLSLATLYTAYFETFKTQIDDWNAEVIDDVLDEGEDLQDKSLDWSYTNEKGDFDIIPENADEGITLELLRAFEGQLDCYRPNIYEALHTFFQTQTICILVCKDLYLLIWKLCNSFCIFDPNGRKDNCERDWEGNACLMKTRPIEHVVQIILNLSDLENSDLYTIYEVRLVNFGFIPAPIEERDESLKKKKYYIVVNETYSLIPGSTALDEDDELEESIVVSLVGLIYACIDPARHWTLSILDGLIAFGLNCHDKIRKEDKLEEMNIHVVPKVFDMGNYRVAIGIESFLYYGHLNKCTNYRFSPLTAAIVDLFTKYNRGIIEIDKKAIAIWRDTDMYYAFDPFARATNGLAEDDEGTCILQMHLTLESFCRVFYMNALEIMSEGNYVIHPVIIRSICHITREDNRSTKLTKALRINFPMTCTDKNGTEEQLSCTDILAAIQNAPTKVPEDCLSLLNTKPCERVCSEEEVYRQERRRKMRARHQEELKHKDSLSSLEDDDKIAPYDPEDIVIPLVDSIICKIIMQICRDEDHCEEKPLKAKKVLLKSDRGYLEHLKKIVKRGKDYDNYFESFPVNVREDNRMISLEEELAVPSNFIDLPDGAWIILGESAIDFDLSENLVTGVSAAVAASVIARRYKISTWDSKIVSFVVAVGNILQEAFAPKKDLFALILENIFPQMRFGEEQYRIRVHKCGCGVSQDISSKVENCLLESKHLIIMFSTFSCAIFRRYNFFYLFIGFPCDAMGYRTVESGHSCFLRFRDFPSMIRRIDFNRLVADSDQTFLVLCVHVSDVEDTKRFITHSPSSEERILNKEMTEKEKTKRRMGEKIAFLNDELSKELRRIRCFRQTCSFEEEAEGEYNDEGEEEESDNEVEKKHKAGTQLEKTHPIYTDKEPEQPELGYYMRKNDCYFKIQGTNSLEGRTEESTSEVRACYFGSICAILAAILQPLSKWNYKRVDEIVETATELFESIEDKSTACERKIDNLEIDDYQFNVTVKAQSTKKSISIEDYIKNITRTKQYFMLQISNCTFAVFKDQLWHVFDCYKTSETNGTSENEEEEINEEDVGEGEGEEEGYPCGIQAYPDRDAASWVLLPTLEVMLDYVAKRASSENWMKQFRLHVVEIRRFKKAPRPKVLAHFLLSGMYHDDEKPFEDINCLPREDIKWLSLNPSDIPWSRLNIKNLNGDARQHVVSRWKAFDIEVPDKLFSLWGNLHPLASAFKKTAGKQYLAVNVIACCMSRSYRVTEWNSHVVDNIVLHGDRYFQASIKDIKKEEYEFTLEDLNLEYKMNNISWKIHLESVLYGKLYNKKAGEFNLSTALTYFFSKYNLGIIQCYNRSLAFGKANKGYFLFDCQRYGTPVFKKGEGCAYVLLPMSLKFLLYCMVITLIIPYYNMEFIIYNVDVETTQINPEDDEDGEEEAGAIAKTGEQSKDAEEPE